MEKIIFDLKEIKSNFDTISLLNSKTFKNFLEKFWIEHLQIDIPYSQFFIEYDAKNFTKFLINIHNNDTNTMLFLDKLSIHDRNLLLSLIDLIYDNFRNYERYLVLVKENNEKISHKVFLNSFSNFANSLVTAYREIYEKILGKEQNIYRVLPSGCNAGILLSKTNLNLTSSTSYLKDVPLVETVVTQPPFIIKTKEKTRKGFFFEKNAKLNSINFETQNVYGILIDVFNTKGVVYFDKKYMGFLVALGNLFHVSDLNSSDEHEIDFIVNFGVKNSGDSCYYYKEDNKYIAICPEEAKIDYFGYAKKIVLTLFNLTMIDRSLLPIHGAGIKIRKGNKIKNFVILGDSGAGKSETIEAIKLLYGDSYQIDTIFDDMGTFHIENENVYCTGSEIGAFVRLDDLDQGYSLRSVDRSVFLNIDEANSRVVIPLGDYEITCVKHKVDCFLLADNFTENNNGIVFYNMLNHAINDFIKGERVAMQTTSEKGLVSTFFANPFGPLQEKDKVTTFINDYFSCLFKNKVPVGRLFTKLSIDRKNGPKDGARKIIELFENMN